MSDFSEIEPEEAVRKRQARRDFFENTPYYYLKQDEGGLPRGTLFLEKRQVRAYPSIPRVLRLDRGLKRHFKGPFSCEEKVDGYNVRILLLSDELVAFTRSGHHCPFTTDRARDFIPTRFFEDHPKWVLCVEVAGPGNPYNEAAPVFVKDDVRYFVFDIMDDRNALLPPRKKWQLVEKYALPAVSNYGVQTPEDYAVILDLVRQLSQERREGLIFKGVKGTKMIKYVTPSANLNDIRVSSELLEELPPHFFINRINRFMMSRDELGLALQEQTYTRVGKALLAGYQESLEKFQEEKLIYHTFRCRFRNRRRAEELLEMFEKVSSRIQVRKRKLEKDSDFYLLTFDKIFLRSTSLLSTLFQGRSMLD